MAPATLDDVLITEELSRRPSRSPDHRTEAEAIARLTAALTEARTDALQILTDAIVMMGLAGSAGVSLRVAGTETVQCFWRAVSGKWRDYVGMAMPLDQTPCSIVIERDTALLFANPGRYFAELNVSPGVHEILMVPLHVDGRAVGAIWAVAHDDRQFFEREDVRLLRRLADLAAVAHRLEIVLRRSEEERDEAVADLQQTRAQLRRLMDGVPLLLWQASNDGRWTWASPQWTRLTGQSIEQSRGHGWLDMVNPDDRRRARAAWRTARGAEAFEVEYRVYDRDADSYRWFQTRATPVHDEQGQIVEWLGTSSDIDDLQKAREHERTLLLELQHRVRNTIAVVRSIARRTIERSETIDEFQMHFDGRLGAFARSQSLVTRTPEGGVDLKTLISDELFVYHAREGDRVIIRGPAVQLKSKIADTLGLAIHELTVNAVKYGGLSSDAGTVAVTWALEDVKGGRVLVLSWLDQSSGPQDDRPLHYGFGRELIERSLVYELDAITDLSIRPGGARCTIRLPLAGRTFEQRS